MGGEIYLSYTMILGYDLVPSLSNEGQAHLPLFENTSAVEPFDPLCSFMLSLLGMMQLCPGSLVQGRVGSGCFRSPRPSVSS